MSKLGPPKFLGGGGTGFRQFKQKRSILGPGSGFVDCMFSLQLFLHTDLVTQKTIRLQMIIKSRSV